jgi:polyhydroxyalkanoate synthesis regulator phasin
MIELIEKSLMVGFGALALTQKKAEELAEELKEKFDLSEEKGRELLDKLRDIGRENQEKLEDIARQEVRDICERIGVVPREEFDKLQKKVAALEKKLKDQK